MKFDTKIMINKPFGPWFLQAKLPEDVLNKMIEITDKISDNSSKVSLGHGLAGVIEDEPYIPPGVLKKEGLYDYFIDLGKYYVKHGLKWALAGKDVYENWIDDVIKDDDDSDKNFNPKLVVEMDKMWIVNQVEGEYNPVHLHTNCTISSVMYLKIPKYKPRRIPGKKHMDGKIELIYHSSGELPQSFDSGTLSIQPEAGDIFMWPSNLLHTVYPFLGKGVRRSVSYNLAHTFLHKSGIPAQAEKTVEEFIQLREARLQTKIDLLEDELKKIKSKK